MATTGKTSIVPVPARRKTGARVGKGLEASAQTQPLGALMIRTAGSIKMGATGTAQSTGVLGFAASTGRNGSTDGLYTTPFFRLMAGEDYKAVLPGTWTGSAHRGATCGFSMNTAGAVVLQTTAAKIGTIIDAVPWDNGNAVADGDVNVVVYFVPDATACAV